MNDQTIMSVQDLAREALGALEQRKRPDGSRYLTFRPGAPGWCVDLSRDAAHDRGNIFPDDYRYTFMADALEYIADAEEGEEAYAGDDWEPDVYTSDLTTWLGSRASRIEYLTEALEEYGISDGFKALALAQELEFREVFDRVLAWLQDRADQ